MDIKSAIGYLKHGYRIRRSSWEPGDYLYNDYWVAHVVMVPDMKKDANGSFVWGKRPFHSDWRAEADDLTADDWELILDGIVSDYGKIEYEDSK